MIVKNEAYLSEINQQILANDRFRFYFYRCIKNGLKYSIRYNADSSGLIVNVVGHFQKEKGFDEYKHISVRLK